MALKELRKASGLTQKELAAASGVHEIKICQIETGKIRPENISLRTALKLSEALKCDSKELMEGV